MERTPFAGLTALDETDTITVDGGSFGIRNPRTTDQLLRVGAVTHRHDAHAALPDPHVGLTGFVSSGGSIAASAGFALTYTVMDAQGGETAAAPALALNTGDQVPPPALGPSAVVINSGGIMPGGDYYYAFTFTDGAGGETTLGPQTLVTVPPGYSSAAVLFAAMTTGLPTGGEWRLWRSYEGEDWRLVAQQGTDTFADTGFDPPDNPAQPPDQNTTSGTFSLVATLPTSAQDAALASGTAINLYLAPDDTFADPCFYERLPIASAGATIVIRDDTISEGSPPPVSLSKPGAGQIYPDTDLRWGVKSPVSTATALPSGTPGDIRLVLDTLDLAAYTPSGWTSVGGGTWKSPVVTASALPQVGNQPGDVRVTLDADAIWIWNGPEVNLNYITDTVQPRGIAASGQHVYWSREATGASAGTLARANQDGTNVNLNFITAASGGIHNPDQIVLASSYLYWVNDPQGIGTTIGRANADGTGSPDGVWLKEVAPSVSMDGLTLATDGQYLYFRGTNSDGIYTGYGIWRVNLDGTGLTHTVEVADPINDEIMAIAVDASHIYWVDLNATILRANKDGSGAQAITSLLGSVTSSIWANPNGLFWMTNYDPQGEQPGTAGSLARSELDGSNTDPSYFRFDAHNMPALPPGSYSGPPDQFVFASGGGLSFFFTAFGGESVGFYDAGFWTLATGEGGVGPVGPQGPAGSAANFVASAGDSSAVVGPFLGFAASGGASVELLDVGGSAIVLIGASGFQGPTGAQGAQGIQGPQGPPGAGMGAGGSGGISLVDPLSYLEFAASGTIGVAIQLLGGASARVLIGPSNTVPRSTQASGYAFQPSDVGTVVESASASAGVGYLINPNAQTPLPLDAVIEVFEYGTGQVQIVPSGNVVLRSDGNKTKIAGQFGTIGLRQRAIDEWVLSGDLA